MRRLLLCLLWAWSGFTADSPTATITGRVIDTYHRPVRSAVIVPIERRAEGGRVWLVPGTPFAVVDETGRYNLTLPPGSYVIAVTPPPYTLDFSTVFPIYFPDTAAINQAQ